MDYAKIQEIPVELLLEHGENSNFMNVETALLVADNPERIKLVIAWTNLNIRRAAKLTEIGSQSENEVWEWLWENIDYSKAELKEYTGAASEISLEGKMKPLIGNRVIYPDGTINLYVQRYLREQLVKLFDTKAKRSPKKAEKLT